MKRTVMILISIFFLSLPCPVWANDPGTPGLEQALDWDAQYGDEAWAKLNLGYVLLEAGRPEEALKAFKSAHRKAPRDHEALLGMGYALQQLKHPTESARFFEEAIALNPQKGDYASLGDSLFAAGLPDRALEAYGRGIEAGRDIAACHNGRGYSLLRLGRTADAAEAFRQAARIGPMQADLVSLGYAESDLGHFAEALMAFDRALARDPGDIEALSGRGFALLSLKRPAEAEKAFRRLIELDAEGAENYNALAYALEGLHRPGEALEAFEHAHKLNPAKADLISLGYSRSAAGDQEGALVAFDEALSRNPELPEAHSGRGYALAALARKTEALAAFRKALLLAPSAKRYADLAYGLLLVGNYHDAIQACRRGLRLDPTSEETWMTLGEAALNLGDNKTAKEAHRALQGMASPKANELQVQIDETG